MVMKRIVYFLIAGTVLSLSACKSSQNAYKEAYDKAVSGDEPKAVIEEPVVANNDAPTAEDVTNISVREEKVCSYCICYCLTNTRLGKRLKYR